MRCHFRPHTIVIVLLMPALLLAADKDRDAQELSNELALRNDSYRLVQKSIVEWSKRLMAYGVESEFRQRGAELAQRETELAFHRTALEARRKATEEQIALLEKKVDEALSSDPLLEELENHLEDAIRLYKAGRTTENGAFHVRLELAERRDKVADRAGRALIQRLSADLVDMTIHEAELEAQRNYLAQQRKKLEPALEAVRELETNRAQLDWVAVEISRLTRELQDARAAERK